MSTNMNIFQLCSPIVKQGYHINPLRLKKRHRQGKKALVGVWIVQKRS